MYCKIKLDKSLILTNFSYILNNSVGSRLFAQKVWWKKTDPQLIVSQILIQKCVWEYSAAFFGITENYFHQLGSPFH
jgi:hypothetical protein